MVKILTWVPKKKNNTEKEKKNQKEIYYGAHHSRNLDKIVKCCAKATLG